MQNIYSNVGIGFTGHKEFEVVTARKRSLRRLCFYRCLSVHKGTCVAGGVCMVVGDVHGCGGMHGCGGHA